MLILLRTIHTTIPYRASPGRCEIQAVFIIDEDIDQREFYRVPPTAFKI